MMRRYLEIHLADQQVEARSVAAEAVVRAGRYHIAKTLLERGVATTDPLSQDNPLIFSAGPFAGTTFSNANRTSVGCKSPLTGGIKEANGGGTFSYALGQQHLAGLTLHGVASQWTVLVIRQGGKISFEDGSPYIGKGNYEVANMLHAHYGDKVSLALCGPVGEYQGLLAGVAFSDRDNRPSRMAARGGVGAVMGSKKVKAIVVEMDKTPELLEPKKYMQELKAYAGHLRANDVIMKFYNAIGTMGMADYQNRVGGLPVRNFTAGQLANTDDGETFKMGGDYIGELNTSRGGKQTHACMPGCLIQCSNVYHGEDHQEVTSPIEYETLGLLGTNCGITDPDHLAALNHLANDLGVDTIELGATLAVMMDAGEADLGDVDWMVTALADLRSGNDRGQIIAQGTARVGQHYGFDRVPVIKQQAISAYDPRVVEATGVTMMTTAQGADHTAGNLPRMATREMNAQEIAQASRDKQVSCAVSDSLGLCIFGDRVHMEQLEMLASAINSAHGTELTPDFFKALGEETLKLEAAFNAQAGFGTSDDDLPEFFYVEPLAPTGLVARFRGADVQVG